MNKSTTRLISHQELKERLDRGDDFKLVMALGDWHFRAVHIPGSISIGSPAEVAGHLHPDDDIVIYCSNVACPASRFLCQHLEEHGFKKIQRYAEGISGWLEAGYPLEGEQVERERDSSPAGSGTPGLPPAVP